MANRRMRKKWLKQQGLWVNPKECWNLDKTIAKWIVPRLKQYKQDTNGYPCREEINTFEDWKRILDKMIKAFELLQNDSLDYDINLNYTGDWSSNSHNIKQINDKYQEVVEEGLYLFAKWFQDLWW